MSKLEEIEKHFVQEMPATWPEGYREACIWLIARIRKLESELALANRRIEKLRAGIHEADSYTDDAILVEGFHALLIADDALAKEK